MLRCLINLLQNVPISKIKDEYAIIERVFHINLTPSDLGRDIKPRKTLPVENQHGELYSGMEQQYKSSLSRKNTNYQQR